MNGKWSIEVIILGLAAASAIAPAQEPVAAVNSFQLTRQEALEIGEVAAIGPRLITYQGLIENAGGPIDNQSMVVQFRAFPTAASGTQRGLTVTQTLLASAVRKGVFSVEMDADELALPDNADDTYLEVAVCSPAPCTPVALAPRQHVTAAALAVSARNLGGVAEPAADGSLVVQSSAAASGVMSLKNQGATATMSLNAGSSEIAASKPDAAAPLKLISKAPGVDQTYMLLDHAAAEVSFAREVDMVAAGMTPSPKLRLNLGGPEVAMSASLDANPAALDFKYDAEVVARIGEVPDTSERVMMVGPQGLLLADEPLGSESNVAALSNYVRFRMIPAAQGEDAQGGAAALFASKLQVQSVSSGVPTTLMEIDPLADTITAYTSGGFRAGKLQIASGLLSNTAGPGGSAELAVNSSTGNIELRVGAEIVDRWTPPTTSGFGGRAPNRISGSAYNYVEGNFYGNAILGGGSTPSDPPAPGDCFADCPGAVMPPGPDPCLSDCVNNANHATNYYGTIAGGVGNEVGLFSSVGGGDTNRAPARGATIAGGNGSLADGEHAFIGGGNSNRASVEYGAIGGGLSNQILGTEAVYVVVGGGFQNTVGHASGGGEAAVIGGGQYNETRADWSVIGGGHTNFGAAAAPYSTIAGGRENHIDGQYGAIGGGFSNKVGGNTGFAATIPGGYDNNAFGDYSLAAGRRATVDHDHDGSFVWADSDGSSLNGADFTSTGADQFLVRAAGGMYFGTTSPPSIPAGTFLNTSTGGYLSSAGVWTDSSDRDKKENFQPLDGLDVLERLADLPVTRWNFKDSDASIQHIGPVAQDFFAAFGVGSDDKHIAPLDTAGVALAAIQGLYQIVREKDCEIEELKAKAAAVEHLEAKVAALETLVSKLAVPQNGGPR